MKLKIRNLFKSSESLAMFSNHRRKKKILGSRNEQSADGENWSRSKNGLQKH